MSGFNTIEDQTCENCAYFHPAEGNGVNRCKRRAPTVHYVDGRPMSVWPATWPHEWCGEFILASAAADRSATQRQKMLANEGRMI